MNKTIFSGEGAKPLTDNLTHCMRRVKAITSAFASGALHKSQHTQAVIALGESVKSLDDMAVTINDSITGSSAFSEVMSDSNSESIMTNLAVTRMGALTCQASIAGDIEVNVDEDMDLGEALEIEPEPTGQVDEPEIEPEPTEPNPDEDEPEIEPEPTEPNPDEDEPEIEPEPTEPEVTTSGHSVTNLQTMVLSSLLK